MICIDIFLGEYHRQGSFKMLMVLIFIAKMVEALVKNMDWDK